MSYRVESASSGRAKCIATECKENGVKIDKDELRLGVWVEYQDRGGWTWKHWGCVTGFQLQNIRKMLADPTKPDGYNWDFLDGYEGDEKNSLDKRPELQAKVRRVIMQGYIDPEDWNGDPEMNKLGEKGLRSQETKQRIAAEKRQGKKEIAELNAHIAAMQDELAILRSSGASTAKLSSDIAKLEEEVESKSPGKKKAAAPKKRPRANEDSDDDEQALDSATPVKKKRTTKAKKEESDDEPDVKPQPGKKSRVKKEVKQEEQDMNINKAKPPKKSRGKKVVKQEDTEDEDEMEEVIEDVKPAKRSRAKKAVKREDSEDEDEVMPAPSKRAAGKRGVKKEEAVKDEPESDAVAVTAPKKAASGRKVVKKEENDGTSVAVEEKPAIKKGRKKAVKKEEADVDDVKPSGSDLYHGSPDSTTMKNEPESPVKVKGEPNNSSGGIESKNNIDIKSVKTQLDSSNSIKRQPPKASNAISGNVKNEAMNEEADVPNHNLLPASIRDFDFGRIPIAFNNGREFADIVDEFSKAYLANAIDGFTSARDGTDDGHAAWLKYLEMKGMGESKSPEPKKSVRGKKASAPAAASSTSRASRSRKSSKK